MVVQHRSLGEESVKLSAMIVSVLQARRLDGECPLLPPSCWRGFVADERPGACSGRAQRCPGGWGAHSHPCQFICGAAAAHSTWPLGLG